MVTTLGRVCKSGFQQFWRNGWLSAATVSVMVLALAMVLGLLLLSVLTQALIANLEGKVDVAAYFKSGTSMEEIKKVESELLLQKEVKGVERISEEEALAKFKERHKEDTIITQVLDELEANPLEASLNIKARDPEQYATIVNFLESKKYSDIITKVNYYENKNVIIALTKVTSAIRKTGFFISMALALVAVLVSFNTIRIAIYTLRDEIGVMKLVGATNWFVRGPFIVAGILYGIVSSLLTMMLFYPLVMSLSPRINNFFPGADLFGYFQQNLGLLWLILLVFGVAIGVFGSVIAIRKYLKV